METISKTKKIILSAFMLALSLVLSRFLAINTPLLAISFNFVPILLSAIWLGPKYSTCIYGLSDLIGAFLFPFGEYFVGFTISRILAGFIYGVILHQKEKEFSKKELIIRLIIASTIVTLLVNVLLNTLWLSIMYEKAFMVLIGTRIIKDMIMLPIQVVTIFAIVQGLKPMMKKYLV